MENATKALLIAGSILIVILIIAMGMKIFNSASGTTDSVETTMSAVEVTTFNNRFTSYLGYNKSKAQIISLLNTLIANNHTNTEHKIRIRYFSSTLNDTYNPEEVLTDVSTSTSNSYQVQLAESYYDENGFIKIIFIRENNF